MRRYRVVLSRRSIADIQRIVDHYNRQQAGLGKRFYAEVKTRINRVARYPFACAVRYDDIRFAMLDSFPYAAHYNIEDKTVIIQGVLSTLQDPEENWIKKK